jgi:hypothetical protein
VLGGLTLPFPVISSLPDNWISRVSYREPAKFGGKYFQCVPIMNFFDGEVPGRLCERVASALRGDHGDEIRKKAEKQYVIYVNHESPSVYSLVLNYAKSGNRTVLVYDGKVGFNRVKLLRSAGDESDQIALKYRKVSEVFVPEMYRHRHDKVQQGRLLPSYHRSFDFVSAELNVDIPDSQFDRKLFDFQYGERMVDETEKKLYVFDGLVGFVPAEDFRFDQSRVPRKSEE